MDLSRMYRIAETGDVNGPTPVDNVLRMAEERQRQQQRKAHGDVSKTLPVQTQDVRFGAASVQVWVLP